MPLMSVLLFVFLITYLFLDFFSPVGYKLTYVIFVPILYYLLVRELKKEIAKIPGGLKGWLGHANHSKK